MPKLKLSWYIARCGTGTTIYGIQRAPDRRIQFTVWLTILWVPIVPISSWSGFYSAHVGWIRYKEAEDLGRFEEGSFVDLVQQPHDWARMARTFLYAWLLVSIAGAPSAYMIWRTHGRGATNLELPFVLASAAWPLILVVWTNRVKRRKLQGIT